MAATRFRVQYMEIKPGGHPVRQDEIIQAEYADCVLAELAQRQVNIDMDSVRLFVCSGDDGVPRQVYPVEPVADFARVEPGRYASASRPEIVIQREQFRYGFSGETPWVHTQWLLLVHGQRVKVQPTLTKARHIAASGLGGTSA